MCCISIDTGGHAASGEVPVRVRAEEAESKTRAEGHREDEHSGVSHQEQGGELLWCTQTRGNSGLHVHVHVYIYIYICIHVYLYIYACTCTCICIYNIPDFLSSTFIDCIPIHNGIRLCL